nr:hypothetical protein FFPRI1PSEUD_29300 [Pseudomonas sp. FFPRI_1]
MKLMFDAVTYSAYTEDEVSILGLADDPAEPGQYLLLQRAQECDEQDRALGMDTYYVELGGQGLAGYGGIDRVQLAPGHLTLQFSQALAWCQGLSSLEVRWRSGLASLEQLEAALQGIFDATGTLIATRHE